MFNKKL